MLATNATGFDCSIVSNLLGDEITVQINGASDTWSFQCGVIYVNELTNLGPVARSPYIIHSDWIYYYNGGLTYHELYYLDSSDVDGYTPPPTSYGSADNDPITVFITPDKDDEDHWCQRRLRKIRTTRELVFDRDF